MNPQLSEIVQLVLRYFAGRISREEVSMGIRRQIQVFDHCTLKMEAKRLKKYHTLCPLHEQSPFCTCEV